MACPPRTFTTLQEAQTHYRRWRMTHEWPVMIDGKRYLLTPTGVVPQNECADLTVEVKVR